jgi:hypothetical protein
MVRGVLHGTRLRWLLCRDRGGLDDRAAREALEKGSTDGVCTLEAFLGAREGVGALRVVAPGRGGRVRAGDCRLRLDTHDGPRYGRWPKTQLGWRDAYLATQCEVLDSLVRPALTAARDYRRSRLGRQSRPIRQYSLAPDRQRRTRS